jgi:hypothetical protein
MFKKISLSVLAAATAMTAMPAAADAHPSRYRHGHAESRYYDDYYGDRYQRGDHYRGSRSAYYGRNSRYYGRDRYDRGRCRDSGTTGTIVGAIAGGLLGKEIAEGGRYRRGDGTTGMIIGGAVGALAGRAIDRNC